LYLFTLLDHYLHNHLSIGHSNPNEDIKRGLFMTQIIGWILMITGAGAFVIKALTDLGIIPVINR
jgi:hypothetical protein